MFKIEDLIQKLAAAEPQVLSQPAEVVSKAPPATVPARAAAPADAPPVSDAAWTLPGFTGDARVMTSFGALPIKALRVRDPLRLPDGTFANVAWIDQLHLDEGFLHSMPDAQPVRIAQGAFGGGKPEAEILVSPAQTLSTSDLSFRPEFRTARDLTGRPGIIRRPETVLTYYLFHCGKPTTVMIEGVWVQTKP